MTSAPILESRLPVGSSARMMSGLPTDGTGDGDTLALAAGELRREVAHAVRETDLFEHGDGGFTAFLGADLTVKKGQFDIIEYVQRIDQMERLEDET